LKAGPKPLLFAPPLDTSWLPAKRDGRRVIAFIERYCREVKGPRRGQLIKLRPWQRELIRDLFRMPRPRRAYIQMPKKLGKSLLGSCIALYGLLGDDEPGAEVYSCAGDKKQAAIVFGVAVEMVNMEPEFAERVTVYADRLEVPSTGSVYRVLSSDGPLQQGLWPHLTVFDEVFNQPDDKLWSAMSLGMAGRERPLLLGITTPGWNTQSLAYRLYRYGKAIEAGEEDPDPAFFFRAFEAAPDSDPYEEETWRLANPGVGERGVITLDEVRAEARITPEADFRMLRCGMWTSAASAWIPYGAWPACADEARQAEEGTPIALAFDGSYSGDASALIAATVEDRPHIWPVRIWENRKDPGWRVPREEVAAVLDDAMNRWQVTELSCDPFGWHAEIDAWEVAYGDVVVIYQTNQPSRFGPACDLFRECVIEGKLTHSGDRQLSAHVGNCHTKRSTYGNLIVKQSKSSERKIDGAVGAVIAHTRARWHHANPRKRARVASF
jgi:phage terminase large subunit-like protein